MYTEHSLQIRVLFIGKENLPPVAKQMKKWEDDLKERLKGREIPPKYWEFPELEKGNIHQNHCAYCINHVCDQATNTANKSTPNSMTNCAMTNCKFGCGARYHICKTSEHLIICCTGKVEDDYSKMYQGVSGEQRRSSGVSWNSASFWSDKYFSESFRKNKEKRKRSKNVIDGFEVIPPKHFSSIGDFFEGPNKPAKRNTKTKLSIPEPPPVEPLERNQLNKTTRVNLSFTNEPNHAIKSKDVYSFTCSQLFRRDQFEWHSKNVHDDIFGSLNDWMEHRCPLASYGCGFSVRRLHPNVSNNVSHQEYNNHLPSIIYSPTLESFGISNIAINPGVDVVRNDLPNLPCEILYQIVHYLDSFRYDLQNMHRRFILRTLTFTYR